MLKTIDYLSSHELPYQTPIWSAFAEHWVSEEAIVDAGLECGIETASDVKSISLTSVVPQLDTESSGLTSASNSQLDRDSAERRPSKLQEDRNLQSVFTWVRASDVMDLICKQRPLEMRDKGYIYTYIYIYICVYISIYREIICIYIYKERESEILFEHTYIYVKQRMRQFSSRH